VFVSSAHLRSGTTLTDEGLVLGNMAFRSVPSWPAGIANFEPSIQRGFSRCNDDLMGSLTLLEAHEYCSQVLTCPRLLQHYRALAPKVQIDQEPPLVKKAPVLNVEGSHGKPRRPPMAATALWVASSPKV
jgi:hypothetical protein